MIKTYIEYLFYGSFESNRTEKEVLDRKKPKTLPKGIWGYRFFDRVQVFAEGEILRGGKKNFSGVYYMPGSKILTIEEVIKHHPGKGILVDNMKINKWEKVIFNIYEQAFPYYKDDVILKEK